MPNTPKVNFEFQNNNVQASVPQLGVSLVVARTTRGKFNDPSEVITSWSQFQRLFGDEIVPDGSISNIKKALEIGSKVRVSRVEGQGGAEYGTAKPVSTPEGEPMDLIFKLIDPTNSSNTITITTNIQTQEAGSPILDNTGYDLNRNFYLEVYKGKGPTNKVYISQFRGFTNGNEVATADIFATNLLFSGANFVEETVNDEDGTNNATPFIEAQVLQDFINNVPNIKLVLVEDEPVLAPENPALETSIKTMEDVVSLFRDCANWYGTVSFGGKKVEDTPTYAIINEGTVGGDPAVQNFVDAYYATKDYTEPYQIILSHIHQHLPNYYLEAYATVAKDVIKNFEQVLYVEVPKYDTDGNIQTPEMIQKALETMVPQIGYAKNIAYFAGGIKYYDDNGSLRNNDVLGSVIGLGDVSASNYGPWYSFSGMNRGVIANALGPVTENLGSPSRIEELQTLAEWYCNLFVIKDTRTQGKRTMLWHGFTSNPKMDSERFLSIVRLNLYIKKSLRPILESYIEEPNTWSTWKNIYMEGKTIMDDLKDRNALTSYNWQGDQFAQSYQDLQINNEADVRQGKYKIVLSYQDIVTLQDITIVVSIDAATREIDITAED